MVCGEAQGADHVERFRAAGEVGVRRFHDAAEVGEERQGTFDRAAVTGGSTGSIPRSGL